MLIHLCASFNHMKLSAAPALFFTSPPSPLPATLELLYGYDQVRPTRIKVPCSYTRRSVYRGASARTGKSFLSAGPPPDLAGSLGFTNAWLVSRLDRGGTWPPEISWKEHLRSLRRIFLQMSKSHRLQLIVAPTEEEIGSLAQCSCRCA